MITDESTATDQAIEVCVISGTYNYSLIVLEAKVDGTIAEYCHMQALNAAFRTDGFERRKFSTNVLASIIKLTYTIFFQLQFPLLSAFIARPNVN